VCLPPCQHSVLSPAADGGSPPRNASVEAELRLPNRHRALIGIASIALLAFALRDPALARDWTARDIAGTYAFTTSEIRLDDSYLPNANMLYCDAFGDLVLYPNGEADLEAFARRCVTVSEDLDQATVAYENDVPKGYFEFEVLPGEDEILLWELTGQGGTRTGSPTHGRITQRGNLLLFDGTGPEGELPTHLLTHAVAARK
jgi:hypothetical protein